MPAISKVRHSPQDLYEMNRNGELNRRAIEAGMTLSAFLEQEDPTNEYPETERLDAFGRQLRVAKIRTVSNPAAGIWADDFGVFDREGNRGLAPEWVARRWKEARFGVPANPRAPMGHTNIMGRSVYTSADDALNTIFRPYFDAAAAREDQRVSIPLMLNRLVTLTTPITGDAYRAAYMTTPDADDIRMVRVSELGEIPLASITAGEHTVRLHKYGRGFEVSTEALRRTKIDKVAFWVQRTAIQQEVDKVAHGLDVLINGDGNSNAATSHNLTTLDSAATPGTLTFKGWLNFKETFGDAYQMDLAIGTGAVKTQLFLLDVGTGNHMAYTLTQLGGVTETNGRFADVVEFAKYSSAPASTIIGVDTSAGLEHVMEIGADLTETDRFVTRQSNVIVMSEVEGFAVLDENATHLLNIAA